MKRELPYFSIEGAFGQPEARNGLLTTGGCERAAVLPLQQKTAAFYFPFIKTFLVTAPPGPEKMTKAAYLELGMIMKPYLKPRITGIDKLSIYMEGFTNYLCDRGINDLILTGWSGNHSYESSAEPVKHQIDAGWPLPYLNLKHRAPSFRDLVWFWFLLGN